MFILSTLEKKPIKGLFYRENLKPISLSVKKLQKIIGQRPQDSKRPKAQVLVKSNNSNESPKWIDIEDFLMQK